MPHWKSMVDREYLFAFDLGGKDSTVEITRVIAGTLISTGGKKTKKPLLYFKGKSGGEFERPLALNSTNAKTIASLYGNDTDAWVGRRITMYATQTQMGGETVDCIRIRSAIPRDPTAPTKGDAS